MRMEGPSGSLRCVSRISLSSGTEQATTNEGVANTFCSPHAAPLRPRHRLPDRPPPPTSASRLYHLGLKAQETRSSDGEG